MFKLYDYDVHTLIDQSMDEYDIINTLSVFMSATIGQRFLIIYHDEEQDMDEVYRIIKTVGQYYDYVNEYKQKKLSELSCMQLKKEILDINSKKLHK